MLDKGEHDMARSQPARALGISPDIGSHPRLLGGSPEERIIMTNQLVFLDIETTGLFPLDDYILEIAAVRVNNALEVVDTFSTIINPMMDGDDTEDWKRRMGDYVTSMHTENGLIQAIETGAGATEAEAERSLVEWLGGVKEHRDEKLIMAGNSIHFDRSFIRANMPNLNNVFHYRMVDVSSIKIMVQDNWPDLVPPRAAEPAHRALADARESLETYRHFVNFLNPRRWRARGAAQ